MARQPLDHLTQTGMLIAYPPERWYRSWETSGVKWFRRKNQPVAKEEERVQELIRDARQVRSTKVITTNGLVQAVSATLFRADPVGINFEDNSDEYDNEAETIVLVLPHATSPEDLRSLTHETFVQWFDEQIAGPVDRYTDIADEIWELWKHQNR